MEKNNNDDNNNNKDDNGDGATINSLPEYKIRTMDGDINGLGGEIVTPKIDIPAPKNVPMPTVKEIPVPKIEISTPKIEPIKIKSPLPEIEDFIVPTPPPQVKIEQRIEEVNKEIGKRPQIEELKKELTIEKLKTENIFDSETKTDKKNLLLIVLGIILLVVVVLGFFYLRGLKIESNPSPLPVDENKLQIPQSLISVDSTKTLKVENNISFLILLQDELKVEPLKTFRRIVPIKNSSVDGREEVLSLSELIKELNISIDPYVFSEFKNNYTLVLYGQEENEKRFGLIVEINNSNNLREQLRSWEKTMIENLYNLFLGKQPKIPANKSFTNSEHRGIPIRFINFPNPDISIDYAILNNLFILSTSKESIRAIIDRVDI